MFRLLFRLPWAYTRCQDLFFAKVRLVGWCLSLCGLRFFPFLSLHDIWSRFFRLLLLTLLRCVSFQCLGWFLLRLLVCGSHANFLYEVHRFFLWPSHFKLDRLLCHRTLFHRFFCPASLLSRFLLGFFCWFRSLAGLPFLCCNASSGVHPGVCFLKRMSCGSKNEDRNQKEENTQV